MSDSSNSKLIEKVRQWLTERRGFRHTVEAANVEHYSRRAEKVKPYRDRLVDDLLAKADADTDEVRRLQEKDLASIHRHLARQEELLLKEATQARKRRRRDIRRIRSSPRRFEDEHGNPKHVICMWFADDIYIVPWGFSGRGRRETNVVGPGPDAGENTVKIILEARSNGVFASYRLYSAVFTFIWQSTVEGWLRATSWVYPNGLFKVVAPTSWWKTHALAQVNATLFLAQEDPNGNLFPLGQSPNLSLVDENEIGEISLGRGTIGGSIPFESATDSVTLNNNPTSVPILSGYPVIATVELLLRVYASGGGTSVLDFGSGALDLTVPSVWFIIES